MEIKTSIDLCLSFDSKLNELNKNSFCVWNHLQKKKKYNKEKFDKNINKITYGDIIYFIENLENYFQEPHLHIPIWFVQLFFDEISYITKKIKLHNLLPSVFMVNSSYLIHEVKKYFIEKYEIDNNDLQDFLDF